MVFPELVVNCEIPVYTASLRWDRFTTEGKEANGTDAPQKAVRCGVEISFEIFSLSSRHTKVTVWEPTAFYCPRELF